MTNQDRRFGHSEHLRLAFDLVATHGLSVGSDLVYDAIERFALANGHAKKFHATLSCVWPRLIAAHMRHDDCEFSTFVNREAVLLDKRLPLRYYSGERLGSQSARRRFVEPDRADLPRVPPWCLTKRA
jgi:hypothetical protein